MFSLYTADEVRKLDHLAIEEFGIPGSTLMARAAEAVLKTITSRFKEVKKLAVVCGIGNNGGDGFVLATIAKPLGYKVTVFTVGNIDDLKGDALSAYRALNGAMIPTQKLNSVDDLTGADLIVDAIFGSGLSRVVESEFYKAIEFINSTTKPVIAVDVPSGLCAGTGSVLGIAVRAMITVSFVGRKRGLFTADGPDHTGELIFDDLKIPAEVFKMVPAGTCLLDHELLKGKIPARKKNSYKGCFGHVLVIGGNHGMNGAALLCGQAALKSGAGLVSVATRASHAQFLNLTQPELMVSACEDLTAIQNEISKATVLALGPGLGQDAWARLVYDAALASDKPLVLDADGLQFLAQNFVKRKNMIITPHPGEAARLLNTTSAAIQKNRFEAAETLSKKYGAVVVLKGCGTVVSGVDSETSVCPYGNAFMAKAGLGDALTGIIAALLAQGMAPADAAKTAVCAHGMVGDKLLKDQTLALTASHIVNNLNAAW